MNSVNIKQGVKEEETDESRDGRLVWWADGQVGGRADGRTGGWVAGWTGGRAGGRADGRADGRTRCPSTGEEGALSLRVWRQQSVRGSAGPRFHPYVLLFFLMLRSLLAKRSTPVNVLCSLDQEFD